MDGSMVRAGRRIAAPYADRLSVINARATDRKQRLVFAAERRRALQQVGSLAYRYNMNSMDLPANRPEEKADMSRMSMAVARHGRRADILRM
jgi:hypothetical protein